MSQYGISYLGSKSKIAEKICRIFPKAENFYDLFGGGFSITHCMLKKRAKDFKQFHFNEIRKVLPEFIKDCIDGKYNYNVFKPEWVSREDFFANKEKDIYKKVVWSFGNNGEDYLFGKEIEQQKKSMHNAIIFNRFDNYAKEFFGFDKFKEGYDIKTRRLFCKSRVAHLGKKRADLQQLEQLQRLQQLEQLEQLERLEFYNLDYRQVPIKENSVIYCDIPYQGTTEYDNGFNHKEFYDWVEGLTHPVFVSEYKIDKPFLSCVMSIKKRSTLQGGSTCKKVENVYTNKAGRDAMRKGSV